MRRVRALLLAAALLGAAPAVAEEPEPPVLALASDGPLSVVAWSEVDAAPAGTTIDLRISPALDGTPEETAGVTIRWPDVATQIESALGEDVVEIERVGPTPEHPGQLQVLLRVWDAGEHTLPAFEVSAVRASTDPEEQDEVVATATVEGLTLTVPSVLPAEGAEPVASRGEIAWQAPGIDVPPWVWLAGGSALVALVLGVLWWRARRGANGDQAAPSIVLPPHERALAALDALLDQELPQRGEFDPYFVQLSEILRGYIEERFGLHAPERTTEEFLAELMQHGGRARSISPDHRELLRAFLERADLVKFARDVPQVSECADAAHSARRFVDDTAPRGDEEASS